MSTRELPVLYMAITYTRSFPCFSWLPFPVKKERLVPGENSRICGALFERWQYCKCLFSAFVSYWLIIGHWQFLSQSPFIQLLFSCPLPLDSEVQCSVWRWALLFVHLKNSPNILYSRWQSHLFLQVWTFSSSAFSCFSISVLISWTRGVMAAILSSEPVPPIPEGHITDKLHWLETHVKSWICFRVTQSHLLWCSFKICVYKGYEGSLLWLMNTWQDDWAALRAVCTILAHTSVFFILFLSGF